MRNQRRILGTLVLALGPVAATGCTTGPESSLLHVLATRPPGDPVRAADLYPLRAGQWIYDVDGGNQILLERSRTDRFGGTWMNREGDQRTEFWHVDDDGNIVMDATIDHQKKAISIFEPPLVIAYRELPPRQPRRVETAMRVVDLNNPEIQRESGTAVRTIEYIKDERIRTPTGEFLVKHIEVRFVADLQMANAVTDLTLYVVPALGVVAEQRRESVKILGLGVPQTRTLTLATAPTEAAAQAPEGGAAE
ncbi:MAG: hypothetical protein ACYSTY_00220 [Planctomycetota bacterium]|jgi:hypothetical protein